MPKRCLDLVVTSMDHDSHYCSCSLILDCWSSSMPTKMCNYPMTASALCSSIESAQASSCFALVALRTTVLLFYQMMTCVVDMELL